jgi:RNA polymerase sigma-70 factor (ECF subfamily)
MTDFDNLFLKYHHQLFRYTLKFIEDENEALDLVQDIFVEVWERGQYKDLDDKVKAYLFTGVKNSCLNYIKHQKVVKKFEHHAALHLKEMEANYYLSGEQSFIEKETVQRIGNAIDSLTDIYKEVIVLSRFEGLKNKEIAERLNIPVRTVETRIFRALSLLKDKISLQSVLLLFINKLQRGSANCSM